MDRMASEIESSATLRAVPIRPTSSPLLTSTRAESPRAARSRSKCRRSQRSRDGVQQADDEECDDGCHTDAEAVDPVFEESALRRARPASSDASRPQPSSWSGAKPKTRPDSSTCPGRAGFGQVYQLVGAKRAWGSEGSISRSRIIEHNAAGPTIRMLGTAIPARR